MSEIGEDALRRARGLHDRAIVIDTHCDTTQRLMSPEWDFSVRHESGHVDIPRLREGGVTALFLAVYAPGDLERGAAVSAARAQIERIHETVRRWDRLLTLARTSDDIRRAKADGRMGILVGIEGGHLIEDSLDVLREFHERGAMYLTLTHAVHTSWADASGIHEELPPRHGGLTDFGREVVRELNRLGMMVDVSHVSDATFWDVVETSSAPIIATHSSCRDVSPHRRNLSDEMIRAIAGTGGAVQINFAAAFVDPTFPPIDPKVMEYWSTRGGFQKSPYAEHDTPFDILVDHFDHALRLVGPDHVGIGSDFDGVGALPRGMEDCSKLPSLTAALLQRGYSEEDLTKVLGENVLRVMSECHAVSRRWHLEARPLTLPSPPDGERRCQSLAYAVRTIARDAGYEIDHDDLNAAMAWSWMICANPDEPDIGLWSMYARDAFLIEAGRLFGMQIREIHPPEAARGLEASAEFDQHFDASYRPLILRALEHGQPVLAWQGWPGERMMSWGVLGESCDEGVGFRGMTLASDAEFASPSLRTLVRPPIQVYVVERITPRVPRNVELLDAALSHARIVLGNQLNDRFGVITGPAAIDEWIARLSYPSRAATVRERTVPPVARLPGSDRHAASVISGCESTIRFLQRHLPNAPSDRANTIRTLISESQAIADAMRGFLQAMETDRSGAVSTLLERLLQARSAAVRAYAVLNAPARASPSTFG